MQLEQIAATGNAAEKALLADVTAQNPDASYVELLRLFTVCCRRWALVAWSSHLVYVASCLLCAAHAHLLAVALLLMDLAARICTGIAYSLPLGTS